MAKLLIFDWDGTLSDSLLRIATCIGAAANDAGLEVPSVSQAKEIVGLGLREALAQLFPHANEAQIEQLRGGYAKHFIADDQVPSPFYPYVMEVLERFREQGYLLAVATGKSRRGLDRVLHEKGLNGFFHASRCADETKSKPDPLMLNELLQQFSLPAEEAVMVGDTEFDMAMAQRAGVPRLAVSYGAHAADRLHKYQPLACIDCFSEAQAVVESYKASLLVR